MESARPLIPQRIRKMCCVRSVVCTVHSTTTHDDVEDSVNVTHPLTHLILYLNQNVYCPQIQVLSCQNGKRKKVYLCPPRSVFFLSVHTNAMENPMDRIFLAGFVISNLRSLNIYFISCLHSIGPFCHKLKPIKTTFFYYLFPQFPEVNHTICIQWVYHIASFVHFWTIFLFSEIGI